MISLETLRGRLAEFPRVLDPVYTGKAWVGLMDLMKTGYVSPSENVLFLHTGGTPALFPYGRQMLNALTD